MQVEQARDYFPWMPEEEAAYEAFARERDQQIYDQRLAEFEADGGDATIEMEDEGKLRVTESEGDEVKDGDGDGLVFDGKPEERAATKKEKIAGASGASGGGSYVDELSIPIKKNVTWPDTYRGMNEAASEKEFKRALLRGYPSGVPLFHETTMDRLDGILANGLDSNESADNTNFATIGRPSQFVNADKKVVVMWKGFAQKTVPDMRYDQSSPYKDLLTEHKGVEGADVAYNGSVPRDKIESVWIVDNGVATLHPAFRKQESEVDPRDGDGDGDLTPMQKRILEEWKNYP